MRCVQIMALAECQKQPPEVFYKKGAFKNFARFIGKHLCGSLFLMSWKTDAYFEEHLRTAAFRKQAWTLRSARNRIYKNKGFFAPGRNQEFMRAGEFPWNKCTSLNISSTVHEKMALEGNLFSPRYSQNIILNEKFNPQINPIRPLFFYTLSLIFQKRQAG